jgi:peptidoglycan/LPS O-acetylase OafA/YrhL
MIENRRSSNLDILRFIAMFAIVGQHCDLTPFGWTGVWLFYVISGFVVTLAIGEQRGWRALYEFYKKRLWRICPPYYLFLLISIVALFLLGTPPTGQVVASAATFRLNQLMAPTHGLWFPSFPISHLWTVSVEMQFYAAMGGVLVMTRRRFKSAILIGIVLICPIARLLITLNDRTGSAMDDIIHSAPLQADAFAAGALLALFRTQFDEVFGRRLLAIGGAVTLIYFAFYAWMNFRLQHSHGLKMFGGIVSGAIGGQFREVILFSVLVVLFSGLIAVAYTHRRPNGSIWRWMNALGRASYSGYLWHFAVIVMVRALMRSAGVSLDARWSAMPAKAVLLVVSMAVLAPISLLMFHYIESPLSKFGHRNWFAKKFRIFENDRN